MTEQKLHAMLMVLTVNRDTHDMLEARGVTAEDLHTAFQLAAEGLAHRGKVQALNAARKQTPECGAPTGTHGRDECSNPIPCPLHGGR